MNAYEVLQRPIITEKSTAEAKRGKFLFVAAPEATKVQIKEAFKTLYGETPKKVNVIAVRQKNRTRDNARKRRTMKKVIITVSPKAKIDLMKTK